MKRILLFSGILSLIVAFYSCQKAKEPAAEQASRIGTPVVNDTCQTVVTNFFAGQHILVGNITVWNDATNLYVTFNTDSGWVMSQTHLYVGTLAGLPKTPSGNPKIGTFPYKATHNPGVTSYTYTIPLASINGTGCIIIAAHANVEKLSATGEVLDTQTGWGAGHQIKDGGSWASYFDYCICHHSLPW